MVSKMPAVENRIKVREIKKGREIVTPTRGDATKSGESEVGK